jgi:hypothetical protein
VEVRGSRTFLERKTPGYRIPHLPEIPMVLQERSCSAERRNGRLRLSVIAPSVGVTIRKGT